MLSRNSISDYSDAALKGYFPFYGNSWSRMEALQQAQ